ncbi:Fur family transcriptional regulator, ferric uptake regulator [Alkalibacterium subtropicum]|uniref:Fur family transcriptional regulator, ferric uptake regulator n=1 Tax=Alkalibacterium subtropicum TaxID=753702 RepID=A0A1I1ELL9_9LACT|nr:Fur family transcriptional regulator [Alkalibacterium subtropicum]SFB87994.1 Fur family transcriptional regulator, ferric uptake regulator [Alkalibacterium subtropicum]
MKKLDSSFKVIKKKLHEAGFKLTPQRELTVEVLLEKEKDHLSAEEVYLLVKAKNTGIGLATVYRTLEILTELQIINKLTFQDGIARYDLNMNEDKHQHHHLLCLKCGKIEEVKNDMLLEIEMEIEKEYHFIVKDHRLTFHGICNECASNQLN